MDGDIPHPYSGHKVPCFNRLGDANACKGLQVLDLAAESSSRRTYAFSRFAIADFDNPIF
jgi:hypothetical protein